MAEEHNNENREQEGPELQVYEVGYLIAPTVAEEKLADEAGTIQATIEKHGSILSKNEPSRITLAYEIEKAVAGKKERFNAAYFGAFVFETSPDKIDIVKEEVEKNTAIVRFLIIKRTRESLVAPPPREMYAKKPQEEVRGKMNEREVDSAIEELVAE